MSVPLIGIPANVRQAGVHEYHGVAQQFITPLIALLGFQPVIIPAFPDQHSNRRLLDLLDGVLLTGADYNIHPSNYGASVEGEQRFDPKRDAVTLPLVRACIESKIPLLGICRGMQEINVALGGTLVQSLDAKQSFLEHRGWKLFDNHDEVRQHKAHNVYVTPNSLLWQIVGQDRFAVNSLHEQGLGKLGDGVTIEAVADDKSVEAISVADAAAFTLGVLWHPEWYYDTTPASQAIFNAFGNAVRERYGNKQ